MKIEVTEAKPQERLYGIDDMPVGSIGVIVEGHKSNIGKVVLSAYQTVVALEHPSSTWSKDGGWGMIKIRLLPTGSKVTLEV